MVNENIETKNKPKEILELERAYEIVLKEEKRETKPGIGKFTSSNAYSLNQENKIIAINIRAFRTNISYIIKLLPDLEYLSLTGNSIEEINIEKENLNLKYLFLGGNKIKKIKPILNFPNLLSLAIWDNPIEDVDILNSLSNLQELYCQNCQIVNFDFLNRLQNIKAVFLSENKISLLPDFINSIKLSELVLDNNVISDVTGLDQINFDIRFDFSFNKIKCIPFQVAKKYKWLDDVLRSKHLSQNKLYIYGNPLEFPPTSVIELGSETVQNYYEAAEQFGHTPLSEGRIIFIGDGSAGKTSIIEKVLYNTFDSRKTQTNGIKIEHFSLPHPDDNRQLSFHIWDFGGQEIQHAVHKFFFSEGCLYVLVLDNRKEEDPEYWLQQIESLGGKAPVLVVFNKNDQNNTETADRKYLKEKYPNIVGFFNTSCANSFGIEDFKKVFEEESIKLRTVSEQFPNNWLAIKKGIEVNTAGNQHYLTFESYQALCKENNTPNEKAQKLLLKYFNTIGAVTWFGDDVHLNMLHVLKPEWITKGVYNIITARKTAHLFGQIHINDFKELLQPIKEDDYTYKEKHYGFILSMMVKFNLCYTINNKDLLIPSAFGKMPKVEYSTYKGEGVRTYYLQFKNYMPLALIHRFITRNLKDVLDSNYWYTGIVLKDSKSPATAMVHADKEAKRIYIRIKGDAPLGLWEHIRRVLAEISDDYAKIPYDEMVQLDEKTESSVKYIDLTGYLKAYEGVFFHPTLQRHFNVGYLMGMFEDKESTIEKIKAGQIVLSERETQQTKEVPPIIVNILNNNNPVVNTNINNQIDIDINAQFLNDTSNELSGELNYLLSILDDQNKVLVDTLKDLASFATDAKEVQNSGEMVSKGWKRKLKGLVEGLGKSGETIKHIKEGSEVLSEIYKGISELAKHFKWTDIQHLIDKINA